MTNQDKQYTIYLRSAEPGKRRVPCTKQQFDDYYAKYLPIWQMAKKP